MRREYVSYSQGRTDGVTPRRGREVDTINIDGEGKKLLGKGNVGVVVEEINKIKLS